jgi:ribosomal protein L11 methyltransferase
LRSILFKPGLEAQQLDILIGALWERGTAGILEEEDGVRAFFADADVAEEVSANYQGWIVGIREEKGLPASPPATDCDPILIGEKFFVVPSSSERAVPPGRIRLAVDAATAFGTGRHESTQLVMEALERYLAQNATVLDVGCGSGILSLAALSLGAARVFGCDVHPGAITTAAQYLRPSPLFRGTIDAVRDRAADLVIANISGPVIDMLAADLNRITRPDGVLILAGFLQDRIPARFVPEQVLEKSGWLCWICRPNAAQSAAEAQQFRIRNFTESWW